VVPVATVPGEAGRLDTKHGVNTHWPIRRAHTDLLRLQ
jgi:hypothetical protein